jgi:hypothetical protein
MYAFMSSSRQNVLAQARPASAILAASSSCALRRIGLPGRMSASRRGLIGPNLQARNVSMAGFAPGTTLGILLIISTDLSSAKGMLTSRTYL